MQDYLRLTLNFLKIWNYFVNNQRPLIVKMTKDSEDYLKH
jgi:hypothetical protein